VYHLKFRLRLISRDGNLIPPEEPPTRSSSAQCPSVRCPRPLRRPRSHKSPRARERARERERFSKPEGNIQRQLVVTFLAAQRDRKGSRREGCVGGGESGGGTDSCLYTYIHSPRGGSLINKVYLYIEKPAYPLYILSTMHPPPHGLSFHPLKPNATSAPPA
jgi:hypothetical protein